MKKELEAKQKSQSPYSLKRNSTSRKASKIKLNEGLIFSQKSEKVNSMKNSWVKLKKNFILVLAIIFILCLYYLYLFVMIIFFILLSFIYAKYYSLRMSGWI